jgi:hypothetical protein
MAVMFNFEAILNFSAWQRFFQFFKILFFKNMQKHKSFNVSLRCDNSWKTVQKKQRHIEFGRYFAFLRNFKSFNMIFFQLNIYKNTY